MGVRECRSKGGRKSGGWVTRKVGAMEEARAEEGRAPQVEDGAPSAIKCRERCVVEYRPLETSSGRQRALATQGCGRRLSVGGRGGRINVRALSRIGMSRAGHGVGLP